MKPIVIIAISVVCSVFAIGVIELIVYEDDIGGSITNIVPFDCARAWDDMRGVLKIQDRDAYEKLSPEEQRKIRQDDTKIRDKYHANWCALNHEEWEGRVEDKDGRFAQWFGYDYNARWQEATDTEYEYNERFPDGALQFQ